QSLFYQELDAVYKTLSQGNQPELVEQPFSYADYARWQASWLVSSEATSQQTFWQDYLADCNEQFNLPMQTFNTAVDLEGHAGTKLELHLKDSLKTIAHKQRGSLFNVLHSAFALLLARLSGQLDLNIGLPVTGRHIYGTQHMLGMFLNNLPVRHQVNLHQSYRDFLQGQIGNIADVLSNQDMPLERILEVVGSARSADSTPLFQVLFNMLSLPDESEAGDDTTSTQITDAQTANIKNKFDLTFYVTEAADGIGISCSYNSQKFSQQAINQLLGQYQSLLTQISEDIDQPCGRYNLNVGAQVIETDKALLSVWPGAVTELFRDQMFTSPDAIAVSDDSGQFSYQRLYELSCHNAANLVEQGVGKGDVVVIVAAREASVVVAIMATLMSGAAYCIVTTEHPLKRIMQQMDIVTPKAVLMCERPTELVQVLESVSTCLDVEMNGATAFEATQIDPQQPACITFTSGSTGVPKAVVGKHKGLSSYLEWLPQQLELGRNDRFSMLSGLAHDPLQRDIFGALCLGATLVIPSQQTHASLDLAKWMAAQQITVTHLTP
ncbi:MAG: condensation domain-containing protein, partial [Psychrosphaera sp.]|nr:condensation domain-containing protein [Psychrosphaera sp.]